MGVGALMPIRPDYAVPFAALIDAEELAAIELLRERTGFDAATSPDLWEHIVARQLGGTLTPYREAHDIDLGHVQVEVKFAHECSMRYSQGTRQVFRWTALSGHGRRPKTCSVTVLVGLERARLVHAWVVRRSSINGTGSATANVPGHERGAARSGLSGYYARPDELLPFVLHQHRAEVALPQGDALFDLGGGE